jgi:hypothetical protein
MAYVSDFSRIRTSTQRQKMTLGLIWDRSRRAISARACRNSLSIAFVFLAVRPRCVSVATRPVARVVSVSLALAFPAPVKIRTNFARLRGPVKNMAETGVKLGLTFAAPAAAIDKGLSIAGKTAQKATKRRAGILKKLGDLLDFLAGGPPKDTPQP